MYIDFHSHRDYTQENTIVIYNLGRNYSMPKNLYSMGLHPWDISPETMTLDLARIQTFAIDKKCLMIGECGLDRNISIDFDLQKKIFIQHIELSETLQKPLLIHCVRAYDDIILLKKKIKPTQKWIVHGFNKNKNVGYKLLENDFYLSFGHALLINKSLQNLILEYPLDHFFLESDDKSNLSIKDLYLTTSKLIEIDLDTLLNCIFTNYDTLFKRNIL